MLGKFAFDKIKRNIHVLGCKTDLSYPRENGGWE